MHIQLKRNYKKEYQNFSDYINIRNNNMNINIYCISPSNNPILYSSLLYTTVLIPSKSA